MAYPKAIATMTETGVDVYGDVLEETKNRIVFVPDGQTVKMNFYKSTRNGKEVWISNLAGTEVFLSEIEEVEHGEH